MRERPPRIAFTAGLPASGSMQFYDGFFPALLAGTYTLAATQTITPPSPNDEVPGPFSVTQVVTVQAPEFNIDPGTVQMAFPPDGSTDDSTAQLPFVVLSDPVLPWERAITPGASQPSASSPTPWIALVIFTGDELVMPAGASSPVTTMPVSTLVTNTSTTVGPDISGLSDAVGATQCQVVTVTGQAFTNVIPLTTDLPYLAHCRSVNNSGDLPALTSVVLCNRLPRSPGIYYAHLVSLEGLGGYLGPDGSVPGNDSGGLMNVQMASLYNWSFAVHEATGGTFVSLIAALACSTSETALLQLPPPDGDSPAATRLQDGYVPLTFNTGAGEQTFAWYRGPFSAVVPPALPAVGSPPVPLFLATAGDSLMIYDESEGLFDLSYSAAWNLGRQLALADPVFTALLSDLLFGASSALNTLAQRSVLPHFAGADTRTLLARDASRRRFRERLGEGLVREWTAALAPPTRRRPARSHRSPRPSRRTADPRRLLSDPEVVAAIAEEQSGTIESIGAWLAGVQLGLPFSSLVPHPAMLPVSSIRFFYVDSNWLLALVAGALNVGIQNTLDAAVIAAFQPDIESAIRRASATAADPQLAGVLIRSELISAWPTTAITASAAGTAIETLYDQTLSADVRLVVFAQIPDTVTLAQPYQGLRFGVPEVGIVPRCVTDSAFIGGQILNVDPVQPVYRTAAGVLDVATTAGNLQAAAGAATVVMDAAAGATAATPPANDTSPAGDGTPAIESLSPAFALAAQNGFTLTVIGSNIPADSKICWNSSSLATTMNGQSLSASIPAASVATAGTAAVTIDSNGSQTPSATFTIIAAGEVAFGAGDFALQLVLAPERQLFTAGNE